MTARLWIALALVLAVLSGAGAWTVRGWRADAAIERMRATVAEGAALAFEERESVYQAQKGTFDDAVKSANKRSAANAADARSARRELEWLRSELATAREWTATADPSAAAVYAATVEELFGQCSDELAGMAQAADGHARDVELLQAAWPR